MTLAAFPNLVCGVFIFFVVSRKITDWKQARKLLNLLLVVAMATTVFAVFDLLKIDIFPWDALLENRFYSVWIAAKPNLGEVLDWDFYFAGRVSSTFGNPVFAAGYLLLLTPVSFGFFISEKRRAAKILYAFTTLAIALHLILTFTRFAWLCLPAGLLVIFLVPPRHAAVKAIRRNAIWLAAGAIVAIMVIAPFFFRNPSGPYDYSVSERLRSMLNPRDASYLERALIWKTALEIIKDHPAIGVGLGNFEVVHPLYQSKYFSSEKWSSHTSYPNSAHNEYLDILCDGGIPSLIFFVWFLVAVFTPAWRSRRLATGVDSESSDDANIWLEAGIIGGLTALLLYAATQFPLHIVPVAVHFWMFCGIIASLHGVHTQTAPSAALEKIQKNLGATGRHILLGIFSLVLITLVVGASAPLRANLYAYWGTRCLGKEDYKRAIRLFDKAVEAYPLEQEILHHSAVTWMKLARKTPDPEKRKKLYEKALEPLSRSLAINPNNPVILNNYGNALLFLDMTDGAIEAYRKSLLSDPKQATAHYNLGIAYYRKRMYNPAIEAFLKCVETEPDNMLAYYNLGNILSDVGKTEDAEKAYMKALKLDSRNPDTLNHMGQFYDSMERYGSAVSAYRAALTVNPSHFSARGNLAISLIRSGKFSEAVPILSALLHEDPDSAIAHFNLGKALEALGETGEAQEHFRAASELAPNIEEYRQHLTSGRKH